MTRITGMTGLTGMTGMTNTNIREDITFAVVIAIQEIMQIRSEKKLGGLKGIPEHCSALLTELLRAGL